MTDREEYVETFLGTVSGAERGDWDWDDEEDLPKFFPRSHVRIDGHVECGFENGIGTGGELGFCTGWIEEIGAQGFRVGGDWEHPVQAFVFRWPDDTILGLPEAEIGAYVPREGNLFNPYNGRPLGNETYESDTDQKWLRDLDVIEGDESAGSPHKYDLTPHLDFGEMFEEFCEWFGDCKK